PPPRAASSPPDPTSPPAASAGVAAADTDLWVELRTPADRDAARAAGMGWAEGQDGDWFRLTGTPAMAESAGLRWRPIARSARPEWGPSVEEVADRLDALVGSDATLVQLGQALSGQPILALRIGRGARALRLLGGHHGDEASSVEVALAVAEALVPALADGSAALPADTELWVVPLVNPDGRRADTRANLAGIDLNRNYAWEWTEDEAGGGTGPFSEPETRAIRALARARSFDAGLSLHSGAQNLGWVWNWTADERPLDEPLLVALAERYAADCTAPGFWLTNGAEWYVTYGDSTDWGYGAWGAYDYTLELTLDKSPSVEDVPTYTAWHLEAILGWLTRPPDRVARVVDDTTGEPLPARITGAEVAPLWTPDGAVARWAEGDSPWSADAPGYAPAPLAAETRLVPTSLLTGLPSPRLLSRGGDPTALTLPGASEGPLTLVQPGEVSVELPPAVDGAWIVDPAALAPGAWTLVTDAGVIPRGLFVGEVDDRVRIADATLVDGVLTVTGTGFATGAEAWSHGGPARAPHALLRLSETDDTLVFALPTTDDDVLVWTNGAWLSVVNVQARPTVDPSPPPQVEWEPPEEEPLDPTLTAVGACSTGPQPGGGGWAWLLLLPLARRFRGARPTS
ncbi:MAG: M14 family zinc carboxypeptidase, partial [Pseudomonadota bacterium]|nr:M14 family zinc carboxypeptidase [Pseudomonadota bacterium]